MVLLVKAMSRGIAGQEAADGVAAGCADASAGRPSEGEAALTALNCSTAPAAPPTARLPTTTANFLNHMVDRTTAQHEKSVRIC